MTKKKKKKTKKKKAKNKKLWGLEVNTFPRYAREEMDYDYIDKLKKEDPKAAEWLSKFNDQYYGNTFRKTGPAVHKTDKKTKRAIYRKTNQRNRDLYNQRYRLPVEEDFFELPKDNPADYHENLTEEAIIDMIDYKKTFGDDENE